MTKACFALFLILVGAGACAPDFPPASRLDRPRILAVQAEPVNPAFGTTTRLRPLVYLPAGESVTYEWSWCPVPTDPDGGFVCPVDQAAVDQIADSAGLGELPPLSLGTDETVEIRNPFPPPLLARLCAGDSDALGLFLGGVADGESSRLYNCTVATLPVQVMLTIRGSTTDSGVISLRLPIDETTAGNRNPVITGVTVTSTAPPQPMGDTGQVTVPRASDVKLLAGVDEAQAETYLDKQLGPGGEYVRDEGGGLVLAPTPERLTLSWFSEGGDFDDSITGFNVRALDADGQPIPFQKAIENTWNTPKTEDFRPSSSSILVVVRDNRGGVAWTGGLATLEDAP